MHLRRRGGLAVAAGSISDRNCCTARSGTSRRSTRARASSNRPTAVRRSSLSTLLGTITDCGSSSLMVSRKKGVSPSRLNCSRTVASSSGCLRASCSGPAQSANTRRPSPSRTSTFSAPPGSPWNVTFSGTRTGRRIVGITAGHASAQFRVVGLPDNAAEGDRRQVQGAVRELQFENSSGRVRRHRASPVHASSLFVLFGMSFIENEAVARLDYGWLMFRVECQDDAAARVAETVPAARREPWETGHAPVAGDRRRPESPGQSRAKTLHKSSWPCRES